MNTGLKALHDGFLKLTAEVHVLTQNIDELQCELINTKYKAADGNMTTEVLAENVERNSTESKGIQEGLLETKTQVVNGNQAIEETKDQVDKKIEGLVMEPAETKQMFTNSNKDGSQDFLKLRPSSNLGVAKNTDW
eukprot:Platyproteum_vivax@DN7480_c2_g1_i3.p1